MVFLRCSLHYDIFRAVFLPRRGSFFISFFGNASYLPIVLFGNTPKQVIPWEYANTEETYPKTASSWNHNRNKNSKAVASRHKTRGTRDFPTPPREL